MNQLFVIDGVSVRRDFDGRYCLNDLHRAAGGEKRHQPSNWSCLTQTQELIAEISSAHGITGAAPLVTLTGGVNRGDIRLQGVGLFLCNVDQPEI